MTGGALDKQKAVRLEMLSRVLHLLDTNEGKNSSVRFITVEEFAELARVSRKTIDRFRRKRPLGFPQEYDVGRGSTARPRFKLIDVQKWLESRALW